MSSFGRVRVFQKLRSRLTPGRTRRLALEPLEERALLSFSPPVNTPVGPDPVAVAVGDFNGDGVLDAAVVNHGSGSATGYLSVLLGNGDGTFSNPGIYRVGINPVAVAVADFDGDGIPDIVTASTTPGAVGSQVGVLLGNGDGKFRPAIFTQTVGMITALAVTDYNGDGLPDVVVTQVGDGRTTGVDVLLGNGDGSFQRGPHFPLVNAGTPTAVAVGDFDQDGLPDIAATAVTPTSARGILAVWLSSDPNPVPHIYFVGVNPRSIAVGYLDDYLHPDNPTLDLAVANAGVNIARGSVSVLYGNGDGSFAPAVDYYAGPIPTTVAVGDFNTDGLPDLAVTNSTPGATGGVAVLYSDGQGGYNRPAFFPAGPGATGLAVGDFNGDGLDDLIVTNAYANTVSVLLQEADSSAVGQGHTPSALPATAAEGSRGLLPDAAWRFLADGESGRRDAPPAYTLLAEARTTSDLSSLDLERLF